MTPEISQHRTDISIFDLDRTITRRGTWSAFLLFAAWNRAPWRLVLVPAVLAAMLGYKAGLCSRTRLKEMMHHLMIGKTIARAEINALANRFCMRMLETNIYPEAIALIDREIAAGRRVMIASASSRFYLAPLARALGVKDEIGTRSKWTGELLTPRIEGENCFGQNKRAMMIERFGKLGLERAAVHIRFYSDDISDRPAFDWEIGRAHV